MRGLLLGLRPPPDRWCQILLGRHPQATLRVEGFVPLAEGRHMEIITFRGPHAERVAQDAAAIPKVEGVSVLDRTRELQRLQVEIRNDHLAEMVRATGLLPQLPAEVRLGEELWFVHADRARVDEAFAELERRGFQVISHGEMERSASFPELTERQEEILDRAVKEGYYAFPRKITLTELAASLGISKSTLSESLMVIEDKVMRAQTAHHYNQVLES